MPWASSFRGRPICTSCSWRLRSARISYDPRGRAWVDSPARVLVIGPREGKAGRRACARVSALPLPLFWRFSLLALNLHPNSPISLAPVTGARAVGRLWATPLLVWGTLVYCLELFFLPARICVNRRAGPFCAFSHFQVDLLRALQPLTSSLRTRTGLPGTLPNRQHSLCAALLVLASSALPRSTAFRRASLRNQLFQLVSTCRSYPHAPRALVRRPCSLTRYLTLRVWRPHRAQCLQRVFRSIHSAPLPRRR